MSNFSQNIQNFQRYGTYIYKFDQVGNSVFNSSSSDFSQVYMAFPLQNIVYNDSAVNSFYNSSFTEFIPITSSSLMTSSLADLQTQLSDSQQQNFTLQNQLNSVITQNEASGSSANQLAIQQVILELRIALGQGQVASDFSDTFPYTPITKPTP